MIENLGRLIYHRKSPSLKVPTMSLHLNESEAPIISIWLSMAQICSPGSVLPLKDASNDVLKFSWTWSSHIASGKVWESRGSSSVSPSWRLCVYKTWTCLARPHFYDNVLPPPRAIDIWWQGRIASTRRWSRHRLAKVLTLLLMVLCILGKFYRGPMVGAK